MELSNLSLQCCGYGLSSQRNMEDAYEQRDLHPFTLKLNPLAFGQPRNVYGDLLCLRHRVLSYQLFHYVIN